MLQWIVFLTYPGQVGTARQPVKISEYISTTNKWKKKCKILQKYYFNKRTPVCYLNCVIVGTQNIEKKNWQSYECDNASNLNLI